MTKKLLLGFLMCLAMAGCEGFNPIGPIIQLGIFWAQGEANKYYHTDQATMTAATRATLQSLEIPINDERADGDCVYIMAGGKSAIRGEDRFRIRLKRVKDQTTRISIRVNVFGDKPYAELIFRNLDRQPGVKDFVSEEELRRESR